MLCSEYETEMVSTAVTGNIIDGATVQTILNY